MKNSPKAALPSFAGKSPPPFYGPICGCRNSGVCVCVATPSRRGGATARLSSAVFTSSREIGSAIHFDPHHS